MKVTKEAAKDLIERKGTLWYLNPLCRRKGRAVGAIVHSSGWRIGIDTFTMKKQFLTHLQCQADKYIELLESMLGPHDPRFALGTIGRSRDVPRTHYPNGYHMNGNCVVDIHIGEHPWDHHCYDQGTWQIAHECVHFLDPCQMNDANYLEEGLAMWFQDESQFHDDNVQMYIACNTFHPEPYATAKTLVHKCMPNIIPAIKKIRATGIRIHSIEADMLAARLPGMDPQTIEELCAKIWPDR